VIGMLVDANDAAELLRQAQEVVADQIDLDDPLNQAAQQLIGCAAGVVQTLSGGDLDSAQEALGCARAAVGIASYVVVELGDEVRKSGIDKGPE
jgi:hypothetical protein